ncbi:Retrovirus-related Pol polyprotein like [Argiope bruennichi]|uniref:Retrovirus-related Pol polyprotein like n=1 Tax=Argiope bruennichi TaxID=94029 RepID=A0A8T0EKK8_ARGBR|nr:Retrovirus-related Pol polyprotein like [Argiope bruennichi]
MEDVIQRMAGKSYNSKMDVKSAFHYIPIRDIDAYKTGFVTPDGHYEFLRMPFGVTNGPSTMTRAIKLAYNYLAPHNVNTYIDDISTSHDDFNYDLKVIYKIFEATQKAGFKLTREKTQFAASEITLFGRIISQDGVRPDPERIAAIERYLTLKSIHEVRSFLGFANQFRKYIRNYTVIAKPLTSVLKETDAFYSELGAVLSQEQNGKRRVIEYASRTLKDAEKRYHSNELECTAVHWALTETFRLYLLGHKFQLITDNYITAYVVAKSEINPKFARYLVDLAQFAFTTQHRSGKKNVIADHRSRFPTPPVCLTVTASYESDISVKQKRDDFSRKYVPQNGMWFYDRLQHDDAADEPDVTEGVCDD